MRTERQIQASRSNGARFHGPVTARGKRNSSRNAVKHGLPAETIVLKSELTVIQKMAVARWRQLRLWGMEKAAMEQQIRREADSGARAEDGPSAKPAPWT